MNARGPRPTVLTHCYHWICITPYGMCTLPGRLHSSEAIHTYDNQVFHLFCDLKDNNIADNHYTVYAISKNPNHAQKEIRLRSRRPHSRSTINHPTRADPRGSAPCHSNAYRFNPIEDTCFHWLRHTYAITMLQALTVQAHKGHNLNPLKTGQYLIGHESIHSTSTYLRCIDRHIDDIGKGLDLLYGALDDDA